MQIRVESGSFTTIVERSTALDAFGCPIGQLISRQGSKSGPECCSSGFSSALYSRTSQSRRTLGY
jgi:hypothetical protein